MSGPAFLGLLTGVQGKGPRWRAICPAHRSERNTRSLAIYEPEIGRLLIKCHAGCDIQAIVGAVGLELDALFPPRTDSDNNKPAVRRPWRSADVAQALQLETTVAWLVLTDIAGGKVITRTDRERAGKAAERCAHLLRDLASP